MKRRNLICALATLSALALGGCASGPRLDTTGVDATLVPRTVAAAPGAARGHDVLWGGAVVSVTPLRQATRIEVLGYPLTRDQRPDTHAPSQGRFWIVSPGFLEPMDYADGRLVTVRGRITGVVQGQVGTAAYAYPVVAPTHIIRWPLGDLGPRVHFGFGVMIGN